LELEVFHSGLYHSVHYLALTRTGLHEVKELRGELKGLECREELVANAKKATHL
jgi:hypothetical protein